MTAVVTPALAGYLKSMGDACPHATAAHAHAAHAAAANNDINADHIDADHIDAAELLGEMVARSDYPCLGARSVFRRDAAEIHVLPSMDGSLDALAGALRTFGAAHDGSEELASFVTVFREPVPTTEEEFEAALWGVLQRLHDIDEAPWPADVAQDPDDPRFAFSFAGTPFFIVGLHPWSSRKARRSPLPMMVFNLHRQFERLRADGQFERMRTMIRRRDERLQGTVNPMVEDYGTSSAARQYSGRAVGPQWRAPFQPKETRGVGAR